MSEFLKPPVGTSDFIGAVQDQRTRIIEDVRTIYSSYGYTPVETPAIENISVLQRGYRGSQEQRLFRVMSRGEELERRVKSLITDSEGDDITESEAGELADLGLRFDLTVPLSRIIEQYRGQIRFPFKRYQISPVWRTDRPSAGRYREFTMLDADTVGTSSLMDDAESIAIVLSVFDKLKVEPLVQVNNRRILEGFAELVELPEESRIKFLKTVSKLGRNRDNDTATLSEFGISAKAVQNLLGVLSEIRNSSTIEDRLEIVRKHLGKFESADRGISELGEVLGYLDDAQSHQVLFNPLLARGIEYYTGTMIDTKIKNRPQDKSSFNGGRYDNVVGIFSDQRYPTVGVTLSLERLMDGLEVDTGTPKNNSVRVVVLTSGAESAQSAFTMGAQIRGFGVNTLVYPFNGEGLGKQFKFASGIHSEYAVIVDQDSTQRGVVKVKNLETGEQREIQATELKKTEFNF